MLKLHVPEMTCAHCVKTIEKAVRSIDPMARVEADLADKTVSVRSGAAAERIAGAIRAAGYASETLAA